jgi:hypothetical protein
MFYKHCSWPTDAADGEFDGHSLLALLLLLVSSLEASLAPPSTITSTLQQLHHLHPIKIKTMQLTI